MGSDQSCLKIPKIELPSFGGKKDAYSVLKKTFLKRFLLDPDLKELGLLFVAEQHRILSSFSFSNKYFGIITAGSLKFINKSTGTVLKVFKKGDMIPLFLMGATSTGSIKESIQFIGEKASDNQPMTLMTLTTTAWEAFTSSKPNIAPIAKFVTIAELAASPTFQNVNIASLFAFGLLVNLACYRMHESIMQDNEMEEPWKDCGGLLLRGRLRAVDDDGHGEMRVFGAEKSTKTAAFAAISPLKRGGSGTASENSSTAQARVAASYGEGSFFALEKCLTDNRFSSQHDFMCGADNTIVGYISKQTATLIEKEFPLLYEAICIEHKKQILSAIVPHVNIFKDLDAESLTTLASHTTLVYSAQDKNLCVSGDRYEVDDPADSVYMLMAGSVKLSCPHPVSKNIIEKDYMALPLGGYAVINDLPVIAQQPKVMYTITTVSSPDAVLLRIPGSSFRESCGTFNSMVATEAHQTLRADASQCSLHDVLFSRSGYKNFFAFVEAELALENIIYWRAVSVLTESRNLKRRVNAINAIGTGNSRLGRHAKTQRAAFAEASRRQVLLEEADSDGRMMLEDDANYELPARSASQFFNFSTNRELVVPSLLTNMFGAARLTGDDRSSSYSDGNVGSTSNDIVSTTREVSVNMDIHLVLVFSLMIKLVDNFLVVDSVNEVNISGKLRADMLAILNTFVPTSPVFREVMKCKYEDNCDALPVEELLALKKRNPGYDVWTLHSELFSRSLMEVLKMLDKGPFLRWKASKMFTMFMESEEIV